MVVDVEVVLGATVAEDVDEVEAAEADVEVEVVATEDAAAREILVGMREDPKDEMMKAFLTWL